ncbi:SAM-dependent methyltransferase [Candidatus Chlamydia sanziniae]|uniref:SAM-dependent methytransferase n=1 Tax=Candidatus Chlamydia sanziniae TaxID=1806891 RepID=A0A1A9HW92_9CHLA|nr:SAM-dependent methyltransferase [Candidatus Chlamydia sanziniae]ANH79115.1 SAM-dependent methytransferase [Candidatus Chlamydia sanziniae]
MTLYLLPNTLGNRRVETLPTILSELIPKIHGLIVESDRSGRVFLSLWKVPEVHKFPIAVLNKNDRSEKGCDFYLEPLLKHGENWGLLSDSGLPCIADPGANLVRRARILGISVQAFSGPCSITLALMLSGFPAQNFVFLGYLPHVPKERFNYIKALAKRGSTFVCIETPYRNVHTFHTLIDALPTHAELCIASNLSEEEEYVQTRSVEAWQCSDLSVVKTKISKIPTVFVFHFPRTMHQQSCLLPGHSRKKKTSNTQ